jgi:hypothetical protein
MTNNIPYMKKDTLTLLVFATAAIALLLLATTSPLPLSNFLLQPVQAQTTLTFQTPKPATGTDPNSENSISLTFYAQGTPSNSNPSQVDIIEGTFNYEVEGTTYPGGITSVSFTNNTSGESISFVTSVGVAPFTVTSNCSTSDNNIIRLTARDVTPYLLEGPVECTSSSSSSQGGGNATSSSSPGTTTTQDSDGDGLPDSTDRCTHNSNPRCFKEGDTNTIQQEQSSSSNRTGNQTR